MSDHPSLKNSVALLGGFGKHRAELLSKEFGIESLYDLLFHFPIRYVVKRGYSEEDIQKLWGENLLRVLDQVQAVSAQWQP